MSGSSSKGESGGGGAGASLPELLARFQELEQALENATSQSESVKLISGITELYQGLKVIEEQVLDLKKKLQGLVERNMWLSDAPRPVFSGTPTDPMSRSDKLGSSTFRQKGWDCIATGDFEGAKKHLQKALELAPDDFQALSSLGWAQAMAEDYDDALMTYQYVLAAKPDDALARVNLGYVCLKKGIFGEAIEHLSKAIQNDEDRKATLYGNYYLGLVYLAREMYEDAESFFQTTVELGPAMCEAYFQLGRARYLAGRKAEAISVWRDGAMANRFNPWAKKCTDAATAVQVGMEPLFD